MFKTSRKIVAASGLAGSLLLSGLGIASAQSSSTSTQNPPATSTRPDHSARLQETLKPLVTAGTITQAQADAAVKALVAAHAQDGGGHGGHWGRGGPRGPGNHADTIAKTLGLTTAQLQTELTPGKTIAQVATAKGVALQSVIDAIVAEDKVEHPDATAADLTARVTNMVNGVRPTRPANAPTPAA